MDHVNWGILGASNFARNHMGPALHAAPGGQLVALATSSPDKAAPFRQIAPEMRVHDSYDALLADPAIDAVYIPLPNTMHVPWTQKALAHGKHVLTEKPVAMTAPEIDTLIAARDAANKLAAEAFMIVFHPQWQRVRDLISGGAIGPMIHVDGVFSFMNRDAGNIRNQAAMGGGALRDIGVYVLGATRFVTGQEPSDISARIRWDAGCDVVTEIGGMFGRASYRALISTRMHPRQDMNFHGEDGVIKLTAPFNPQSFGEARVELHQAGQTVVTERFPMARHYELQVAAFNASVLTGASYACPLEFSKGTQVAIDRVLEVQVPME
ncbi:Gfo/Idh/MocA family protein [Pseudoruegeria sp. SK021]|uniref:Gfo/Idh/MocA family protein n=1 Tax=Pseudoruegeria sp. SK021 TaxID=1933035 RepID=UPI000A231A51|nr:Gfo/Idh/MocA family oxidoreductase [Pseudoruegeria sp. SK021]OSP56399.1 oxidoreductase [Pseudoruegeria sp. SK021]